MADIDRKQERGKRLRRLRDERGWTRPQLMEKAGLGAQHFRKLNYWEEGTFDTSDENWEALAKALGVSFHFLYNGDEILPPPADILKRLDRLDAALKNGSLKRLEGQLDDLHADVRELLSLSQAAESEEAVDDEHRDSGLERPREHDRPAEGRAGGKAR